MERGEVRPDAVNGHVLDAVPAMTMYRSTVCASEWNDQELKGMIDQLMLSLLRRQGV